MMSPPRRCRKQRHAEAMSMKLCSSSLLQSGAEGKWREGQAEEGTGKGTDTQSQGREGQGEPDPAVVGAGARLLEFQYILCVQGRDRVPQRLLQKNY